VNVAVAAGEQRDILGKKLVSRGPFLADYQEKAAPKFYGIAERWFRCWEPRGTMTATRAAGPVHRTVSLSVRCVTLVPAGTRR
jgi:hypothetical protein